MTDNERQGLRAAISAAQVTYRRWWLQDGVDRAYLEDVENGAIAIVEKMLAARDAEIERLKARQITPDMEAAYDELTAWWYAGTVPSSDDLGAGVLLERKLTTATDRAMKVMKGRRNDPS